MTAAATNTPARPTPVAHPTAVLTLVLATYLMIIVDTSVVVTGLPAIQADLGLTATGLSWVQTAYTLTFGGLLLLGARAGDLFGRRRVLLIGLVTFAVASLAVGAAGMTALVYGIVRSADTGWADPVTIGAIGAGLLLLAGFLLMQRTAAHPILPLGLFTDRVRVGAYLARFCFIGAMITYFLFVSQFLQDVQGWTALAAGLAFLPMTLVNFLVAAAVPWLTGRVGAARMMLTGLVLALAGMVWLTTLTPTSAFPIGIAVPGMLIGAGQGLLFAHLTAAGLHGVPADRAGAASGAVNAFHQLGAAVGLGLTATLAAAAADRTPGTGPAAGFTDQVTAALTGSSVLLAVALIAVAALVVRPARRPARVDCTADAAPGRPAPATG